MICRFRVRVPIYTSALLLCVGLALAAQATQPVTQSQMESFVYASLAAAGVSIVAAFWILISFVTARVEKSLDQHVTRLEAMVAGFSRVMQEHHEDPMAHPRGSAVRLDPINAKLDSLGHILGTVHEQTAVLVAGQTAAVAELTKQDVRMAHLEKSLATLLAEHHLLHGRALQHRVGDPPNVDVEKLRGPCDKG